MIPGDICPHNGRTMSAHHLTKDICLTREMLCGHSADIVRTYISRDIYQHYILYFQLRSRHILLSHLQHGSVSHFTRSRHIYVSHLQHGSVSHFTSHVTFYCHTCSMVPYRHVSWIFSSCSKFIRIYIGIFSFHPNIIVLALLKGSAHVETFFLLSPLIDSGTPPPISFLFWLGTYKYYASLKHIF